MLLLFQEICCIIKYKNLKICKHQLLPCDTPEIENTAEATVPALKEEKLPNQSIFSKTLEKIICCKRPKQSDIENQNDKHDESDANEKDFLTSEKKLSNEKTEEKEKTEVKQ